MRKVKESGKSVRGRFRLCLCAAGDLSNGTVSPGVKAFPQPDGSMKPGTPENMWWEVL